VSIVIPDNLHVAGREYDVVGLLHVCVFIGEAFHTHVPVQLMKILISMKRGLLVDNTLNKAR